MTNWDRWCLGLTVKEKRKLICCMYDDCHLCPLDTLDDCCIDNQVSAWIDKTFEIKVDPENEV